MIDGEVEKCVRSENFAQLLSTPHGKPNEIISLTGLALQSRAQNKSKKTDLKQMNRQIN